MLPTFIIAGPPKAGTSSLQYYIRDHPDIYVPEGEPHFFCDHYNEGLSYYEQFFKEWSGQRAVGEKTPCYFYMPEIPERIKKDFPAIKLLFIFRNPIDRAYSHYWHNVRRYVEKASFEEAIQREKDGKLPTLDLRIDRIYKREPGTFSYLSISRYAEHIERWQRHFDKSQMLFVLLEDLSYSSLHDVLRFLEVNDDYAFGDINKKYNIGGAPRSRFLMRITRRFEYIKLFHDGFDRLLNFKRGHYPKMNPDTRASLDAYFKPYNKDFAEMTGCSVEKWHHE